MLKILLLAFYVRSIFIVSAIVVVDNLKKQSECLIVSDTDECPNENINFYLYNRFTQDKQPYLLNVTDENSVRSATFVNDCPMKLLIHGYTGHKDYSPNMELRPVYLRNDASINVISVDYGNLVKEPCYLQAVRNIPIVAKCIAHFVDSVLQLRNDVTLDQFHIIGLSLGAQVAGLIHRYFQRGNFVRVTGLDPAMPLFARKNMLNVRSGQFVDVIHTNAGLKGQLAAIGHVDFYGNFGVVQPGCGYNTSCSHVRSVEYYAESIVSEVGFWSQPCSDVLSYYFGKCRLSNDENDLIPMGEYVPYNSTGVYFFRTNSHTPFARGKVDYKIRRSKILKNLVS